MKKFIPALIFLVAVAALFYLVFFSDRGTEFDASAPDVSGQTGQVTVEASLGEEVSGLGVSITPLEVLEDSRCPVNAQCVWEGQVKLKAKIVSGLGESEMTFITGNPITTETEEISLIKVSPDRSLNGTIAPRQYNFTFYITKKTSL